MANVIVYHPDMTNVAAGQKAAGFIETDMTHYGVSFECLDADDVPLTAAEIDADIEEVSLRVDGTYICEPVPPSYLAERAEYYLASPYGYERQNGIIHIPFGKGFCDSAEGRSLHVLGMVGVRSFTAAIKIKLTATKVARIRISTESSNEQRVFGKHIRIEKIVRTFAGTGKQEITDLPVADPKSGVAYNLISIAEGAGEVEKVTLKLATDRTYFEELTATNNKVLLRQAGRSPQADFYHMDFCRFNHHNDKLDNAELKAFRADVFWKTSPGGSFNIFAEREYPNLNA